MRFRAVVALAAGSSCAAGALAQPLGPTPYLCQGDSPFANVAFTWHYLETFESGMLRVPGVTPSAGTVLPPGGLTDSVDCDDGMIDGNGNGGHSFFFADGGAGVTFTFDATVLGALPTHAGIVWTDGLNPIMFQAFDAHGAVLCTIVGNHADGSYSGETAEDRFYGCINAGGISAIHIWCNAGGGIEVDHLQYGVGPVCYANCDGSTTAPILNVNDFICFQSRFAAGDPYANCDGSTAPPVLNVNDFICFQTRFAAGCS